MKQSPSLEANTFLSNQEIFRILRSPEFHCYVHKSSPLTVFPNKVNQISSPPRPQKNFNIIFPSEPTCSKLLFPVTAMDTIFLNDNTT